MLFSDEKVSNGHLEGSLIFHGKTENGALIHKYYHPPGV